MIKENVLTSIKEFLEECLIYESLPQNSQVIIVDKSFSCYDTFNVFVNNDCVDCVTWNSDVAFFERILTYTDICEVIVKVFLNNICKIDNKECNYKNNRKNLSYNLDFQEDVDDSLFEEGKFEMESKNFLIFISN